MILDAIPMYQLYFGDIHCKNLRFFFDLYGYFTVGYPGLGGVRHVFVIFAHAQIVGRCGFERAYSRSTYVSYTVEPLQDGHHWDRATCPLYGGCPLFRRF